MLRMAQVGTTSPSDPSTAGFGVSMTNWASMDSAWNQSNLPVWGVLTCFFAIWASALDRNGPSRELAEDARHTSTA
jgi:hypothetical protein